jgi:hypothetical protein
VVGGEGGGCGWVVSGYCELGFLEKEAGRLLL